MRAALSFIGQSFGLTSMWLGHAVVSLWKNKCLFKDSAAVPLICKAVFLAIVLFLCVLFFKESLQIYFNLIMNLLSFWLWASSALTYPQIPLQCMFQALLSNFVQSIMQIMESNLRALTADHGGSRAVWGQRGRQGPRGWRGQVHGINHCSFSDKWVCASSCPGQQL